MNGSSYSESDVSMSPSKILEKLQVLRQKQLLQRGKLEKQQLLFQETTEMTSGCTELVSHFSSSPSYNTFRSLLESPRSSLEHTPRQSDGGIPQRLKKRDLIEGVSMLNLSQETEFIQISPTSLQSQTSITSENHFCNLSQRADIVDSVKKQISLDDMPILQPKKDFETLVQEKLKSDSTTEARKKNNALNPSKNSKKPFLRKGEGMSRFGIERKDLVIQKTKSLPWLKKNANGNSCGSPLVKSLKNKAINSKIKFKENLIESKDSSNSTVTSKLAREKPQKLVEDKENICNNENPAKSKINISFMRDNLKFLDNSTCINHNNVEPHNSSSMKQIANSYKIELPKEKHPVLQNKSQTWAAVFTKEQNDFLKQLKQSEYYRNFVSPCKSTVSDATCNESVIKMRQEREATEQNMFELLENKVSHESFSLENSFFSRFLRKNKMECSGESTPLVMQKVLAYNPNLLHIFPDLNDKKTENDYNEGETCNSEYTDCCNCCDCCASEAECCNCEECKGNAESNYNNTCIRPDTKRNDAGHKEKKSVLKIKKVSNEHECDNDILSKNEKATRQKNFTNEQIALQVDTAEINEKLAATSELLKDRLRELEDEIETFRKENANLTKMREEIDLERQKFYEDKQAYEQKFNEEKILSEYYLAEEKEKLTKQKQTYERYVREMRGHLNKKQKDEVINLKKEINDLKDEIRLKDAKSTSTIARLRNQLKLMEKEKKDYQDEIEKLKKEIKRIQHSNDVTRRLTNIKYLEEINKKLETMNRSSAKSDTDVKYKAFEIERQSRSRKVPQNSKNIKRPRAKSVPNLKVTSRYAKYFSQRDILSDKEKVDMVNVESYNGSMDNISLCSSNSPSDKIASDNESEGTLEKIYEERFKKKSPKISNHSLKEKNNSNKNSHEELSHDYFIQHSDSKSKVDFKSPNQTSFPSSNVSSRSNSFTSKSPTTVLGRNYLSFQSSNDLNPSDHLLSNSARSSSPHLRTSKSPVSIQTNRSSGTKPTSIQREFYEDKRMAVSPEPTVRKTNLKKTNLSPTEINKLDGSKELLFPNGNKKFVSADGQYSKFSYYNGDIKENFFNEGRIKYFYAETKTYHTTHADGLEVIEFSDGQVEKHYKDGSSEIRLPNGSIRYFDPKNKHVLEEWRFPDGATVTVSSSGEKRIVFPNGQVEVHANDHKRREYPDGTVKLVYTDGTSETRYSTGRVRIKDKHGNLIMDSATT